MNSNPLLAELYSEIWAMEPVALSRLIDQISAYEFSPEDLEAFHTGEDAADGDHDLDIRDGVAHIPIRGTMVKTLSPLMRLLGVNATSTESVRRDIARANASEDVSSILLDIESPGGMVKGVEELAGDVRDSEKPITAHATDIMTSAAYWVGSQAQQVTANAMGTIGSIGVYTVANDISRAYENRGIKTHVITSNELKGVGVPGAPLTDAQVKDMQRLVDQYASRFVDSVVSGRGVDRETAEGWATGQVWLGEEAQAKGLIDHVRSKGAAHKAAIVNQPEAPIFGGEGEKPKMSEDRIDAPDKGAAEVEAAMKLAEEAEARAKEAEEAKARAEAQLEDMRRDTCSDLIDRAVAEGRVLPPQKEAIEDYAKSVGFDATKVKAFLDPFEAKVRPEPESTTPAVDNTDDGLEMSAEEIELGKSLGMSVEDLRSFENVYQVSIVRGRLDVDGKDLD